MQTRTRTALFVLVIAFFVIAAPLIVLYARGYSFKTESRSVVRTGMILLDTNVPKVTVTLAAEEPNIENDPVVLRGLVPGTYHVELEREGFQTWQADLEVEAEKVTRVDDIVLLYEEPEVQQPISSPVGNFAVSPNSRYVAYTVTEGKDAGLWMHTNGNEDNRLLADESDIDPVTIKDLRWSQNSRLLLLRTTTGEYLHVAPHINSPTLTELPYLKGLALSEVQLDNDEPTIIYYRDASNRLFRWRSTRQEAKPELLAREVLNFAAVSPKVFVLQESQGKLEVQSLDMREDSPTLTEVATLQGSQGELLAPSPTRLAVLADGALHLLARVEGEFTFTRIGESVDEAAWSPDGSLLMYRSGSEIWLHDEEHTNQEPAEFALTVLSQVPDRLDWYPDGRHLVLSYESASGSKLVLQDVARTAPLQHTIGIITTNQPVRFTRGGQDLVYIPNSGEPGLRFATISDSLD